MRLFWTLQVGIAAAALAVFAVYGAACSSGTTGGVGATTGGAGGAAGCYAAFGTDGFCIGTWADSCECGCNEPEACGYGMTSTSGSTSSSGGDGGMACDQTCETMYPSPFQKFSRTRSRSAAAPPCRRAWPRAARPTAWPRWRAA
jgi:hypothetical protein